MMKRNWFGMAAGVLAMGMTAMAAEPAASADPVFHLAFDEEQPGAAACVDRMNPERVCKFTNPKRCSFAPGRVGNALMLDNPKEANGTADNPNVWIDVPRFWDMDYTKALSIEVWVRMAQDIPNYKRCLMYIVKCGGQYGPGFSLYYNSANFMFQTGNGKPEVKVRVVAPVADLRGQWVHIAATYDGEKKTARLYLNGECVKENTDFVIVPTNRNQRLEIGSNGNSRGWRGAIDDLKIYKRVLTPAEILEHAKGEL